MSSMKKIDRSKIIRKNKEIKKVEVIKLKTEKITKSKEIKIEYLKTKKIPIEFKKR
jgi:hypothetical protein